MWEKHFNSSHKGKSAHKDKQEVIRISLFKNLKTSKLFFVGDFKRVNVTWHSVTAGALYVTDRVRKGSFPSCPNYIN